MTAKLSEQVKRVVWNPYIRWFIQYVEDESPESPTIDVVGNYLAYWTEDHGSIMDMVDKSREKTNLEEVMVM